MNISISALVGLVRAAYEAGGNGFDPCNDHVEYETIFDNHSPRITAAAIRGEVAGVMEELQSGKLLCIGDELHGRELSEGFTSLVYDLLTEQIEQTDGVGESIGNDEMKMNE